MFAPPVPTPAARQRATVPVRRPSRSGVERPELRQRPIANQAMLRFLRQRASGTVHQPGAQLSGAASAPTTTPAPIQAKLKIGRVDDPLEHEADRAAEQVMRTPGAEVTVGPPRLSRKCACGVQREGRLQPRTGSRSAVGEVPGIVQQVLASPGQPLDAASRAFFEPRFGHDLSQVRVHADGQAAESARAVDALAFTAGQHVVFGAGRYGTETAARRELLAHELAHTIQQSRPGVASHGEAVLQRQPVGEKEPALPELRREDEYLERSPRYIDNIFDSVSPPSMFNGATTFFWEENGAKKKITIPLKDLEQDETLAFIALWKIHKSKEEALRTVELYSRYRPVPGFRYYSFYTGNDGVLMPTQFSRGSTPKFHALWPDLKRLNAETAAEIAEGYRQLAGAINPYPCTEVDENGHLRLALNFGNCALPVLLHAYAIRSATGTTPRPSEPPTRPARTTAPPTPPPTGEAPRIPATGEPVRTEPVRTEPAKPQAEAVTVRTPAQLERHLEQLGVTSEEIRGLAGGSRRGQFSKARAALIERLLKHFTPADMKALGKFLGERGATLDKAAVDALIDGVAPGRMGDRIRSAEIAEVHGEATRLPAVEGAKEESLSEAQDPSARATVSKKKPSPGPEPRAFQRGNFVHKFAEYLLDARRLPRPSQAEVVVELLDGTGDIIRTDRIISHADRGELLEIKPAGRSAEIGEAQLPGRLKALQEKFPKRNGWTGRIVEYTAADARAWLAAEAEAARKAGLPVPDVEGIMRLFGF